MKKNFPYYYSLLTAAICVASIINGQAQFKIVGYVPNWINLTTFSSNFTYSNVTHLNIAFKDPNSSGVLPALSSGETALLNAAHSNGVKVLLSLCGGASSSNSSITTIYFNLINSTNRSAFCSQIKKYVLANNLDGIDIDLEGAAINSDYGGFIQVLADTLHPSGKVISAAIPASTSGAPPIPVSTFNYFDWVNIMAYDACGPTWGVPGQPSPYSLATNTLTYWQGQGLPKSKSVLGVPFYGYEFGPSSPSQYAIGFNTIAATYPSAVDNDQVASTGGNTIYYNGVFTIADKTSLALTSAGGIMIWSLDLDAPSPNSLLTTIRQVAGTAVTSTLTGLPEMKIAVYPNPSNGVFTLQNSDVSKLTIVLLNTVGEKKSISVNNNTIDISNEPKGVYYLQITKDNQTVIQKLIVQ